MTSSSRLMLSLFGVVLAACAGSAPSLAQDAYPSKPIRWIIGTVAGGGSDIIARTVAAQLGPQLNQQIIVENRPGAGMSIAAEAVAKSPADGYTMLTADVGVLVFNTALFKSLGYAPKRDFASVGMLARFPLLLVTHPGSGYDSAKAALDAMRAAPGKLSYASAGIGSPHHLAMELLKDQARLEVTHISYKGAAPAIQDTMAGVVPFMVIDSASGTGPLKSGKLRGLATFTKARVPNFPDLPAFTELGFQDFEAAAWQGVVMPAATPPAIVEKMSGELQKALSSAPVQTRFRDLGLEPLPSTAQQMTDQWLRDEKVWPPLIRARNITLD